MRRTISVALALSLSVPALAAGYRLAAYKDDLFKYPKLISSEAGGDYVVVEYVQKRDLDQRDVVPEKKTKDEYVSLVTTFEQDLGIPATDALTRSPDRLVDMVVLAFPALSEKVSATVR